MNASQGAQMGAAVGGPWGAVAGAVIGTGMQEYSGGDAPGAGGGGPFMGGNSSTGAAYGTGIDKSGMVFNFGGEGTTSTSSQRSYNQPQADVIAQAPVAMGATSWAVPAIIGAAALALLIMRKRKG